ncbi:MAG: GTP-sensing pleiotropic transcriptional regulator CodY [Filifactoraceae bacterium]
MSILLEKTRKVNGILQKAGSEPVDFELLARVLSEVSNSNIYIINVKGVVLGSEFTHEKDSLVIIDSNSGESKLSWEYTQGINKITETKANLCEEAFMDIFKDDIEGSKKLTVLVPILGGGQRLGTLILARYDNRFSDNDLVLAEYSATVIGLEILRALSEELEVESRKLSMVQMAIGTLSYSEKEAVDHIFNELNGNEGLLVASKIADRAGITRSVIVNALRKFESAGVIESRSLGMKGTHIKILNDKLLPELMKNRKY